MAVRARPEPDRSAPVAAPRAPAPPKPLELAGAVGNQAFIRMLGREPAAPAPAPAPPETAELDTDKLAVAIMTTGKKGAKIHSLADLRDLWSAADKAIRMEPRKGKLPWTAWKQLRAPEVEPALTAMSAEERPPPPRPSLTRSSRCSAPAGSPVSSSTRNCR